MPFCCAASVRERPSRTNASASTRRTCAPSLILPARTRSSAALCSVRVIVSALPIRCISPANRRRLHRIRPTHRWESPESQRPRGLVLYQDPLLLTVSKKARLGLRPRPRQRQCLWKPLLFNMMGSRGDARHAPACFARRGARGGAPFLLRKSQPSGHLVSVLRALAQPGADLAVEDAV